MTCACSACTAKRKTREQWGVNAKGTWKQESTYFVAFAEERWERRLERIRERNERNLPTREPGEDDE